MRNRSSAQKYGNSGAGVFAPYQNARGANDVGVALDIVTTFAAQRCATIHGDGRDGGGGPYRGVGRTRHPHGGWSAGGRGADQRDCCRSYGARDRALGYTETLGMPSYARALRATMAIPMAWHSIRRASSSPPAPPRHSSSLSLPCSSPATGSRSRCRAIRLTGISCARSAASRC